MATYFGTPLEILKDGTAHFVVECLQKQHLEIIRNVKQTRCESFNCATLVCSECNKRNLLPKHSKDVCPSQKSCLCKRKSKYRRPCPNGICDNILEKVIEAHQTLSPNLKHTQINKWSQDFWEIAKCFMAHDTTDGWNTDVVDLLHIMANNRYIRRTLDISEDTNGQTDDVIHKVIQACIQIRAHRKTGKCTYINSYHQRMQEFLNELLPFGNGKTQNAKVQLEKLSRLIQHEIKNERDIWHFFIPYQTKGIHVGCYMDFARRLKDIYRGYIDFNYGFLHLGILLEFIQRVFIISDPEKVRCIDDVSHDCLEETTTIEGIFGNDAGKAISHNVLAIYSTNEEKAWFFDNIVRWKLTTLNDKRQMLRNLIIVSLYYARKLGVPLNILCKLASQAIDTELDCIIVMDYSHEVTEKFRLNNKNQQKCKLIELIHKSKFHEYNGTMEVKQTVLLLDNIKELVLSSDTRVGYSSLHACDFRRCLYNCYKRIDSECLEKITFRNILFDIRKVRLRVPFCPNLKIIKLEASKLIPRAPFIEEIHFDDTSYRYSHENNTLLEGIREVKSVHLSGATRHILRNLKCLVQAWEICPRLEQIFTSIFKVGHNKSIALRIEKSAIEKSCRTYFGKPSSECTVSELSCMTDLEMTDRLINAFDIRDFKTAESQVEKRFILESVCFSALQSDERYADVYPAKYKKRGNVVLICITREDRYSTIQRVISKSKPIKFDKYFGFELVEKSIYTSSHDSVSDHEEFDEALLKDYYNSHHDNINEVVEFHSGRLMKQHRNLVAVAVSIGEASAEETRVNLEPCVVLYVRAKSFVPYGEPRFPKKLTLARSTDVSYSVQVREGNYISLADAAAHWRATERLSTLVIGCSVGPQDVQIGATMGPLVECTYQSSSFMGFLTACHLFQKPACFLQAVGTKVVQPSDADEQVDMNTGRIIKSRNKTCGEVVASEFSEHVDAALVKISDRSPSECRFITPTIQDLHQAGFSHTHTDGMPKYQSGRSLHVSNLTVDKGNADKRIVKFGKATGLKRGHCALNGMSVSLLDVELHGDCPVSLPRKVPFRHQLKGQLQIESPSDSKFFQQGDSGCGVYLVDSTNNLWSIGMGIGLIDGKCVVTPIHVILDRLQYRLGPGYELKLKSFEPEEMSTD